MSKLKLWLLGAGLITFSLLSPTETCLPSGSGKMGVCLGDVAYAKNNDSTKSSRESSQFPWMWLGVPLGVVGIAGGFSSLLLRSQRKNSTVQESELKCTGNTATSELNIDLNEIFDLNDKSNTFVSTADKATSLAPSGRRKQREKRWEELERSKRYWQQLEVACNKLAQIIQNCTEHRVLPKTLAGEVEGTLQKLRSQTFRVAVVGEFSKGKSTLLNALLGEDLQPVRAIACSGTVTVLRYGQRKRVVCRYKNGREEEIPFEQYKVKAAISEEAAIEHRSDELGRSKLEEIIFEHPELELCRNGVEIVDSPGLNEHPDRTAITLKLLKNTDAVIFLTSASQILTQGERELLKDLKTQLNGGNKNVPAKNLFVVVNFMDQLRNEKDRQQVQQLVEKSVQGQNPIIKGENRVHFISAQAALDAIVNGTEDDYLKSFQAFSQSLEKFLTTERGLIKLQQSVTELKKLIQSCLFRFNQVENKLDEKVKDSEAAKQDILEQIGEASGRDVRIQYLADQLIDEAINQAIESFNQWYERLGERMVEKSEYWHSKESHIFSQDKLIRDYADQFIRDLQREIDDWGNSQLRDVILKQKIEELNKGIRQEIEGIQKNLQLLDLRINTKFSQQTTFKISGIDGDIAGAGGFRGGIGAGGALAAGLLAFTGIGLIPIIIAAVATAIAGSFGLGLLDVDGIHDQIKIKVIEQGFKKFSESRAKIRNRLGEIISSTFNSRVEAADEAIKQIISSCENLLEQQEKAYKETLEQRQAEKAWIAQKRQELEQVKNNVEAILNQCTR